MADCQQFATRMGQGFSVSPFSLDHHWHSPFLYSLCSIASTRAARQPTRLIRQAEGSRRTSEKPRTRRKPIALGHPFFFSGFKITRCVWAFEGALVTSSRNAPVQLPFYSLMPAADRLSVLRLLGKPCLFLCGTPKPSAMLMLRFGKKKRGWEGSLLFCFINLTSWSRKGLSLLREAVFSSRLLGFSHCMEYGLGERGWVLRRNTAIRIPL